MKSVVFFGLFVGASAVGAGQQFLQALNGIKAGVIPPALMQQLQTALSAAGSTPEVISSVTSIVMTLGNTASDIKAAHSRTQTEIDDMVESIGLNQTLMNSAHTQATQEDTEWVNCVKELKEDRQTYDTATQALIDAQDDEQKKCAWAANISSVKASVPPKTMTCNFEEDSSCENSFNEFSTAEDTDVETAVAAVNAAVQAYNTAALACNVAGGVTTTATNSKANAKTDWEDKTGSCNKKHGDAKDAICGYQKAYDLMCSSIAAYDGAKARSNEQGTSESWKDREAEWKTAKVSQCLLQALLDKQTIDADACLAGVDYIADVGQLDLKGSTVDDMRVQCANTATIAFTYSGQGWAIAEPVTSASSYTSQSGVTITSESLGCGA